MSQPHVLLTGASGFIGTALGTALVRDGFSVTALSRHERHTDATMRWAQGDISDPPSIASLINRIDVVINCAAKTWNASTSREPASFFAINRDAAVALRTLAERAGVRAFIQLSSTGVFGPGIGRYDESTPCNPTNLYEVSKWEAEGALLARPASEMPLVIVRPSNVFGERHPRQKLLTWLRMVQQGRAVLATGAARYWVNYVYLGDVTRAITALARMTVTQGSTPLPPILNLNCPVTSQAFFEASARALDVRPSVRRVPGSLLLLAGRTADVIGKLTGRHHPITTEKARELTNRQVFSADLATAALPGFPWSGLEAGLRHTVDFYRKEGLL